MALVDDPLAIAAILIAFFASTTALAFGLFWLLIHALRAIVAVNTAPSRYGCPGCDLLYERASASGLLMSARARERRWLRLEAHLFDDAVHPPTEEGGPAEGRPEPARSTAARAE